MDWPIFRRLAPQAPPDDRSGVVGDHHSDYQPRVPPGDPSGDGGQWTKVGGAAAIATPALGPRIPHAFRINSNAIQKALSAAAPQVLARAGVLLSLVIPTNQWRYADGNIPGHADVQFRYDEGVLTVFRPISRDRAQLLFHGIAGDDGAFREADGSIIGRDLGADGFLLSEIWLAGKKLKLAAQSQTSARANDDVQLCPDPVDDIRGFKSASSQLYQWQITRLPPGKAVLLNGVMFDGCRTTDGVYLEAKGKRYAAFIEKDLSDWRYWFEDPDGTVDQMRRQSIAAHGHQIEWHVAEERAAVFFEQLRLKLKATEALGANITIINTKPISGGMPK